MRTRERTREAALGGLLDAVVRSEIDAWLLAAQDRAVPDPDLDPGRAPDPDPGWSGALWLFAAALAREWDVALTLHASLPAPTDPQARWLRAAAHAWASSGDPSPVASRSLEVVLADLPDPRGVLGRFAAYLGVEAALAHARLDVAQQLVDTYGDALWAPLVLDGTEHDYGPMLGVCRTRLLAFHGEVGEAGAVYRDLPTSEHPTVAAAIAATGSLVRGNEGEPVEVRRLADVVRELAGRPRDHLTSGAHLLLAFGLIAVGDVAAAVRAVLAAGLDADLAGCNVIDRALGLELLTALAVAEGDLDAAHAWLDRALPLLASPIADSTVARTRCRVLQQEERWAEAIVWAERAIDRAVANDRGIEAAEAQILLNRARLASREPGDRTSARAALEQLVVRAETHGHRAARVAAARELRPLGVRLRPLAGSGWAGLSAREAEVARWVARGATNRQVATRLYVSEHTVRAHVSRVLAAFGVATRACLPAAMGCVDEGEAAEGAEGADDAVASVSAYAALTPRQEQVAGLVAQGLSNREIGEQLGLSVRTVERHVGDVLQRWALPGRTSLARAVGDRDAATSSAVLT